MRSRGAYVTGYNAQAMAVPVSHGGRCRRRAVGHRCGGDPGPSGQRATAAPHRRCGRVRRTDSGAYLGRRRVLLRGQPGGVRVTRYTGGHARTRSHTAHPYHYRHFTYDPAADRYQCPEGRYLTFRRSKTKTGHAPVRLYQASGATCRACPAFGLCTTIKKGRRIEVSLHDAALQSHRHWMETPEARAAYRLRKQLVEPVFGIVKEQQGARRFLLRGIEVVRSEWSLLAVAFNLRTLQKAWRRSFFGLTRRGRALSRALSLWPSPSDTLLACPTHTPVLHRPAHIETFRSLVRQAQRWCPPPFPCGQRPGRPAPPPFLFQAKRPIERGEWRGFGLAARPFGFADSSAVNSAQENSDCYGTGASS